jgi:hypothetical protein
MVKVSLHGNFIKQPVGNSPRWQNPELPNMVPEKWIVLCQQEAVIFPLFASSVMSANMSSVILKIVYFQL